MWKKTQQTYWEYSPFKAIAKAGIQLKLVDSKEGPGEWLRNAMWHTGHTRDHVKLIWQDTSQRGWQSKVVLIFVKKTNNNNSHFVTSGGVSLAAHPPSQDRPHQTQVQC